MSNALAIAHVTQALALLLENNVGPEFGEAVKVEPRKPPAEPPDHPTINVFLYQVTPNTAMRNNDLPTRAADGKLVKRPAAALDLHYLISAYGDDTELVGQRLIGAVVRTLHEIPILPKDVIEQAGERPYLAGSDLAEAAQRVRFSPTVMDIDETSKLWGMLHQTPYSLSVVYQASLIFIDGRETPVPAKPVERPEVRVLPFGAPGAPVPPGAEPRSEEPSTDAPARESAQSEAPVGKVSTAVVEKKAPAGAKKPAKAVAKAPARTRKTAVRTPRSAPGPRKADGGGENTEQ
ncbi:DUF4255 domain-containing protein [Streptomyces bicolor]|uniref:DUF4255 domain-containing protein n=1 Tax=Streptomyces bicolor TaxID=66874 RepID=UPI0004E1D780|nr:DUF4255 domain-containing protein [Streptomyces bicolor]